MNSQDQARPIVAIDVLWVLILDDIETETWLKPRRPWLAFASSIDGTAIAFVLPPSTTGLIFTNFWYGLLSIIAMMLRMQFNLIIVTMVRDYLKYKFTVFCDQQFVAGCLEFPEVIRHTVFQRTFGYNFHCSYIKECCLYITREQLYSLAA
jgi:hypothetical protein